MKIFHGESLPITDFKIVILHDENFMSTGVQKIKIILISSGGLIIFYTLGADLRPVCTFMCPQFDF